jgi:hypothetical protein
MFSGFALVIRHRCIIFVEGVASIVLCFFKQRSLVVFVLIDMVQHMLLLLGNKKAVVLLLAFPFCSAHATLSLSFLFDFSTFLPEVIKTVDELFGQEALVLLEAIFLAPEGSGFDVLYFELDGAAGDGGDVDVEVIPHKIIITVSDSTD